MRFAPMTFALAVAFATPAMAVDEPDGYRMDDYDAPVPEELTGATVVDDDAAYALWKTGRVVIIDVMPDLPRPKNLPKDVLWRGRKRDSIPGAIWLPYSGFGEIGPEAMGWLEEDLAAATGGDKDAPVMFLCRADCWMSWNASKRALSMGYTRVFWYAEGSTGWRFWEWPMERMRNRRR
ncbi:MAG: rhodanese-like domain-containing protein [Pseudomonadota bacterium]